VASASSQSSPVMAVNVRTSVAATFVLRWSRGSSPIGGHCQSWSTRPRGGQEHCSKQDCYSVTSSARASTVAGISVLSQFDCGNVPSSVINISGSLVHDLRNAISGWYSGEVYQALSASILGNSIMTTRSGNQWPPSGNLWLSPFIK